MIWTEYLPFVVKIKVDDHDVHICKCGNGGGAAKESHCSLPNLFEVSCCRLSIIHARARNTPKSRPIACRIRNQQRSKIFVPNKTIYLASNV